MQKITDAINGSLVFADDTFSRATAKDLDALRKKKSYREILPTRIDVGGRTYEEATLLKHLAEYREHLKSWLEPVTNGEEFVNACEEHVEHIANKLFFVDNDEMAAEMAIDHFREFLNTAIAVMHEPKDGEESLLTEQQVRRARELLDLCEVYIKSYSVMRNEVGNRSNRTTYSLVAYAQASYEKSVKFIEDEIAKGSTEHQPLPPITYDEHGYSPQITAYAYKLYKTMLQEHGLEFTDDNPVHPSFCFIIDRAEDISSRRAYDEVQDLPKRSRLRKAKELQRKYYSEVISDVIKIMQNKDGEEHNILTCVEMLEDKLTEASHAPDEMHLIMKEALEASNEAAMKKVKGRHEEFLSDTSPYKKPLCAWIYEAHGNTHRSLAGATAESGRALKRLGENLRDSTAMGDVVKDAEEFVDSLLSEVAFGGVEPVTLLAVEDYLKALQSDLGDTFAAHHLFEANEMHFAKLTLIREKCRISYDAALALNDWVQDDSYDAERNASAHDTFFIRAFQQYTARPGIGLRDLTDQDDEKIRGIAVGLFKDALKKRNIYDKEIISPYTALIHDTIEDTIDKVDMTQDDRHKPAEQSVVDQVRAHNTMAQSAAILNRVPREDEFGRKTKIAQFSAENIVEVMQFLERSNKLAGAKEQRYM